MKFEKCLPGEVSDHSHSGSQLEDCILPDPGTRCVVYGPAAMASPGTVRHGDSQAPVRWLNQNLTISPLKAAIDFSAMGHLAMLGDIFHCYNWGSPTGSEWTGGCY